MIIFQVYDGLRQIVHLTRHRPLPSNMGQVHSELANPLGRLDLTSILQLSLTGTS